MTKLKTLMVHGRRFGRDQRGSPAVEFALIAPVLILFVFGIVQFGFAFYTYNEMMNGAREGARRMAVGASDAVAIQRAQDTMALNRAYTFTPVTGADAATMTIGLKLSEAMVVAVLPLPQIITNRILTASVTMHKE